jgi:hypothetical protein
MKPSSVFGVNGKNFYKIRAMKSRIHTFFMSVFCGVLGCAAPRLPPPPVEAPIETTLEIERIRRGAPPVSVNADIERDEGRIRMAILQRRPGIQECIERVLPSNPEVTGRIDLTFVVEVSGLIHDAVGETAVAPLRAPRECILTMVRAIRIEGVQHPAAVHFAIEFENPPVELTLSEMIVHPRMRVDGPTAAAVAVQAGSGVLTAPEAQALLDAQSSAFLGCYTPLLRGPFRRGQARPQGIGRFELNVAPNGEITGIERMETTEPLPQATECLQGVLQSMRFRATGRRTKIRTRFVLRPQEGPSPTAQPTL